MSTIGIVEGSSIGKGFRSKKDVVLLTVKIDDPDDVQRIEYLFPSGECSIPEPGSQVLIHIVSEEYKVATAVNSGVVSVIDEAGEKAIYSYSSGDINAIITLLNNGTIVMNNGTNHAAQFEELKAGFDSLVSDFNGHLHTAPSGATTVPTVLSTASIDNSEIESILVP